MKKIPVILIFSILLIASLLITGCSPQITAEPDRVALVFDSLIADDAFSLACLRGAEKALTDLGVGLSFTESGTPDGILALHEKLAKSAEYKLIIGIGATQTDALRNVAAKYPDQKFAQVDGTIFDKPNLASLVCLDNENSFLVGALAAMVTKTDQIGFIGGKEESSILRFLAGYRAGAQYIKPECKILVDYAGTWLNDGQTKMLALKQINQGADVVFGPAGGGSLGVIAAAQEKGVYALGVDIDQSPFAPRTVLASTVKNVNVPVYEVIKQCVGGRFSGGFQTTGLKEGGVGIAINNDLTVITQEIKDRLTEIRNKIISTEIIVPLS